jgi:hypothetical protein
MPAAMKEAMVLGQQWGEHLAEDVAKDLQAERAGATKKM